MQQGSDYTTPYYPHHHTPAPPNPTVNPNPVEFPNNPLLTTYASAPPYSHYSSSSSSDVPPAAFSSPYPPYPQNPDPVPNLPPTAPSYAQPQSQPQTQIPPFQTYNPSSYPPQPEQTYPHLQQPVAPSVPYYPHDSHQPAPNYVPPSNPNPNPYSSYESPYENPAVRYDHSRGNGYFNDNSTSYGSTPVVSYGRGHSGFDQDFYDNKPEGGFGYDQAGSLNDGLGEGVYAYDGGESELYGSRGTGPARSSSSSSWSGFDDYGRPKSLPTTGKEQVGSLGKIVRAVPNVEAQQDVKNGVQKFRVKLLPEGSGQSTMDVLCQIGLDGIRMLDPSTSRTLRIYPLDTVTRWEVTDPAIYTFWAKSSVDIEPRRIRLQSNSYTTNTILDTVTAATVQFKEMGGGDGFGRSKGASDSGKSSEETTEKKKGFDWMNLIKPGNEEKDHWVPDEAVTKCTSCGQDFGPFLRKHHCRNCGDIFCDKCTPGRIALTADEQAQPVRVCDRCMAEVTQRLSNSKEIAKSVGPQSHEDLARKLQEEMEKNRKASTGSKSSDGSGRQMREVACPTCTVHLQVQVPSSGSETIECGVCQHPFLVSAH